MSDENDLDSKIEMYLDKAFLRFRIPGVVNWFPLYRQPKGDSYNVHWWGNDVEIERNHVKKNDKGHSLWGGELMSRDVFLGWYREQSLEIKREVCDNIQRYLDRKPMTPEEKREYQEWLELTCPF